MKTKDILWDQLPRPENAQQRVAYLKACQNHFAVALEEHPLQPTSTVHVEGAGRIDPPRFISMNDVVVLPKSTTFCCAVCGEQSCGRESSSEMANPFSRWVVLVCPDCSQRT